MSGLSMLAMLTAGQHCLICGEPGQERLHYVGLIVRTPHGSRLVHWQCADQLTFEPVMINRLGVWLTSYTDGSAAVAIGLRPPNLPMPSQWLYWRDEFFSVLSAPRSSAAERAASAVHIAHHLSNLAA